jgi:hypothetical protein
LYGSAKVGYLKGAYPFKGFFNFRIPKRLVMILFNRIILLLVLFFTGAVQAQSVDSLFIRKLADEILLHSKAYENLRVLTKKIGPRLAGSSGMVKAEKWGLTAMQQAGADNSWMQL